VIHARRNARVSKGTRCFLALVEHKKELKPATDFWQTMDAYLQVPSFASYSSSMYPWSNRNTFTSPSPTARGGTAPVAQLNNAPTFQAFINQTIDRLISLGRGAPSAVGDGKTIGASMRWSQAALSRFPVELWPQVDLVENWHCAEVACLAPTTANLKLRHDPSPAPVRAMVLHMIAEGHIGVKVLGSCVEYLCKWGSAARAKQAWLIFSKKIAAAAEEYRVAVSCSAAQLILRLDWSLCALRTRNQESAEPCLPITMHQRRCGTPCHLALMVPGSAYQSGLCRVRSVNFARVIDDDDADAKCCLGGPKDPTDGPLSDSPKRSQPRC